MLFIVKLKDYYKRNERILIPTMLVFGVIVDFITFRTIKISSAFIILAVYWLIAGYTIIFIHKNDNHETLHQNIILKYYSILAPLVIQFTFGATLSASFIFYWFSGAFSVSWPFMFLIAMLMIANEAFRKYYMKPVIQISVYYFITFSLATLMLPYLFNSISAWIFAFGGTISLTIGYLYLELCSRSAQKLKFIKKRLQIIVFTIFALMNLLYFTNLIPPIPLSLTEAGVYHHIERQNGNYILQAEQKNLIERIIPGETVHVEQGNPIYIYSSIFAPFDLNTEIVHQWQQFDSSSKRWVTKDELSFTIYGGRDEGYRGFSQKSSLSEGFWRVRVQTSRGQTIGVIRFKLLFTDEEVITTEIIK